MSQNGNLPQIEGRTKNRFEIITYNLDTKYIHIQYISYYFQPNSTLPSPSPATSVMAKLFPGKFETAMASRAQQILKKYPVCHISLKYEPKYLHLNCQVFLDGIA